MCAQTAAAAPSLFLLNLLPAVYVVGVGVGHTHHARLLQAPWEAMRMIMRFTPCSIAAPLLPSLGASPWASHQNFPFPLTNLTYGQIWESKGGGRKLDKSSLLSREGRKQIRQEQPS